MMLLKNLQLVLAIVHSPERAADHGTVVSNADIVPASASSLVPATFPPRYCALIPKEGEICFLMYALYPTLCSSFSNPSRLNPKILDWFKTPALMPTDHVLYWLDGPSGDVPSIVAGLFICALDAVTELIAAAIPTKATFFKSRFFIRVKCLFIYCLVPKESFIRVYFNVIHKLITSGYFVFCVPQLMQAFKK